MSIRLTLCLLFLVLVSPSLKADTLTRSSKQAVNGKVTYMPEQFTIEAKFKDGVTKSYYFKREQVMSVEINKNYMNQGPPPDWINKYETSVESKRGPRVEPKPLQIESVEPEVPDFSRPQGLRPKSNEPDAAPKPPRSAVDIEGTRVRPPIEATDDIRFNNGKNQIGRLTLISLDAIRVRIGKAEVAYSRDLVHSIVVGR